MSRALRSSRFLSTLANPSVDALIDRLEQGSIDPSYTTLAGLLGSCANPSQVNRLHRIATKDRHGINPFLGNQLLQIYVKMGDVDSAARIFPSPAAWSVVSWTCLVAAFARYGHFSRANALFREMLLHGATPDKIALLAVIQLLQHPRDLEFARTLQGWIHEAGLSTDLVLGNALIAGYSRCQSLIDATRAFHRIARKDTISWNSIIAAHVSSHLLPAATTIFHTMQHESSSRPDAGTLMVIIATFVAPVDLPRLERFHRVMIHDELLRSDTILATALLTAYARSCGSLAGARDVFRKIDRLDLVSINSMIAAFAHHHRPREAIELFHRISPELGVPPDKVSFLNTLGSIASAEQPQLLGDGFILHTIARSSGHGSDLAIATALVDMYAKCGDLAAARAVFDSIQLHRRDLIAWNAMLSGYSRAERFAETMEIFHAMRAAMGDELLPTRVSIAAALTACANLLDLESGVEIHALAARSGVEADVGGLLIHMYAACGDLDAANRVFDVAMGGASINRDLSSWNSMITAYTDRNLWEEALSLVHQMHHQGMAFDDISFVTALNACAAAGYRGIPHGTSVHLCVAEAGREEDVIIRTALLNMYGKCRDLCRAEAVFDALRRSGQRLDLIAWNAMGSALAQHEEFERVLTLYGEMLLEGVTPDEISFVNALTAAATAGRETLAAVHSHVVQRGMNRDVVVATVLVAAYGSAAEVRRAEEAFAAVLPYRRDVVLWNAMIDAYGGTPPALRTYDSMDIAPDKLTLVLALNACAGMAELAAGERIHRRAIDLGFDRDVGVITALIHMYASCGRLEQSQEIFHGAQEHTMFMWNALVSGFARRGQSERAIALFERMQQSGHRADAIGFVSILSACSQAGLIGRGCEYFASLLHDHGILPYREHYACMIDLFGRAGRLEEAEEWLRKMPAHKLSKSVWETLLGACSIHSDVKRGRRAAEELFEMQSRKSSPYVIMAKLAMLSSNRGES